MIKLSYYDVTVGCMVITPQGNIRKFLELTGIADTQKNRDIIYKKMGKNGFYASSQDAHPSKTVTIYDHSYPFPNK